MRGQQEESVPTLAATRAARSARCCARAALRTQPTSFTHSHPTHLCNALLSVEFATRAECSWLRQAAPVKELKSRRRDGASPHSHAASDELCTRTLSQPPTPMLECHRCKILEGEDTEEGSKETRTRKGERNPPEGGQGECPPPLAKEGATITGGAIWKRQRGECAPPPPTHQPLLVAGKGRRKGHEKQERRGSTEGVSCNEACREGNRCAVRGRRSEGWGRGGRNPPPHPPHLMLSTPPHGRWKV